jgi:hypothetical protein
MDQGPYTAATATRSIDLPGRRPADIDPSFISRSKSVKNPIDRKTESEGRKLRVLAFFLL